MDWTRSCSSPFFLEPLVVVVTRVEKGSCKVEIDNRLSSLGMEILLGGGLV